jgi:hypothetical protein
VSEPTRENAVSEVPAEDVATEVSSVTEETAPVAEAVTEEAPVAEATEAPTEAAAE